MISGLAQAVFKQISYMAVPFKSELQAAPQSRLNHADFVVCFSPF